MNDAVTGKGKDRAGLWAAKIREAQEALGQARAAQDPLAEIASLRRLVGLHGLLGDRAAAVACVRRILRLRRQLGDPLAVARALIGVASMVARQRGFAAARRVYLMALPLFRAHGTVLEWGYCASCMARILQEDGRMEDALAAVTTGLEHSLEPRLAPCRWSLLETRAAILRSLGDLDGATQALAEAFQEREREGFYQDEVLVRLGDLYRERGQVWQAGELFRMGMAEARRAGHRTLETQAKEGLAALRTAMARPSRKLLPADRGQDRRGH